MSKIQELQANLDDLTEKQNAVSAAAGEEWSDDHRAQFDALEAEYVETEKAIAVAKADEERQQKLAAKVEALKKSTRRTSPEQPRTNGHSGIEPIGPAWERDTEKRGFSDSREYYLAILDGVKSREVSDQRLKYLAAAGSDEQSTFADPFGGFLIPPAFSPDFLTVRPDMDPIAGRTTAIPMASPQVKINARTDKNHSSSVSGGLRVYRRAESDTVSSSRMEMEQVTLNAHQLYGVAYATEEVLERSPISFIALLEAGFRDEFASVHVDELINGSGVGEYEGILNAPALVSIAKETGQAATTIVRENVVKMRARCWGYRANAIWLAHHDTLPQLSAMSLGVGTGGAPIYHFSVEEDVPDTLLGRPIFYTEYVKTVGTKGDILCCNWSQYLEGTLSGLRSAESMHVRFVEHERTFKFWIENDGRCWWRSAMTPANGSNTLSPFVSLDTRA